MTQEIIDLHYSSHINKYVNLVFLTELSHYGIVYQIGATSEGQRPDKTRLTKAVKEVRKS